MNENCQWWKGKKKHDRSEFAAHFPGHWFSTLSKVNCEEGRRATGAFSFFLLYSALQKLFLPLYLSALWFILLQIFGIQSCNILFHLSWSSEVQKRLFSRICRHILLDLIQLDFMGKYCHKGKGRLKLCSCPQVRAVSLQHMSPELCPQGGDLQSLEIREKASQCPSCSSSLLTVHLAQCWQPMTQKTCCGTRSYHVSFFSFIIDSFHSSILLWDW